MIQVSIPILEREFFGSLFSARNKPGNWRLASGIHLHFCFHGENGAL